MPRDISKIPYFANIGLDGVLRVLRISIVFHFNLISQMGESPTRDLGEV
jgi:hypothetical protein